MEEKNLSNYYCSIPFKRLEFFTNKVYTCCPTWINDKSISYIDNNVNTKDLEDIRLSVLDGSFKYCNKSNCVPLSRFIYQNDNCLVFNPMLNDADRNNLIKSNKITEMRLSLDDSCNLTCPSCRNKMIMSDNEKIDELTIKLNNIVNEFGKDVEFLEISGSCEPFASKLYRNFLFNFDETKFPKLKHITLITNANLLDEITWNKMINIHKYIKRIQISIDASTEETYKIVRRGGNWKKLIENIKFLSNIKTIEFNFQFVVQDTNYKEMNSFIYEMITLFNKIEEFVFIFIKINNWGTYTEEEYKQKKIWDESHPEFNDFLSELQKTISWKPNIKIITDMSDIISKYNLTNKKRNVL